MDEYGVLTGIVDDVGALIAASTAIMLSFKGRQPWEPSEEDIPKGPVKVVGALTAVGVGLLYWASRTRYNEDIYLFITIACSVALLLGFLFYVVLITVYTYEVEIDEIATKKIIGGFYLTPQAREIQQRYPETRNIQRLLKGAAYEVRDVWPEFARALAKVGFLLTYFIIIVGGCLALAAVAIMLDKLPEEAVKATVLGAI